MAKRVCRLTDKNLRQSVDLRDYSQIIIDTINKVAPNKNPVVEEHSFSTDVLTHSEAIKIGLALAEIPAMTKLGILVSIFRLFDGRIVKDKEEKDNDNNDRKKVSNHRRNSKAIPSRKQKTDKGISKTVP